MADFINIHEAKTHLSRLVEEVAAGREVIIAKAGKPMARLVPLEAKVTKKSLGLMKGKFKIPPDFNEPLPDSVMQLFERD